MLVTAVEFLMGLAFFVPTGRDQLYRWRGAKQDAKASKGIDPWRRMISAEWRRRRDLYDRWDALSVLVGLAALIAIPILKAKGY